MMIEHNKFVPRSGLANGWTLHQSNDTGGAEKIGWLSQATALLTFVWTAKTEGPNL
jgi:hypothetical protein